MTSQLAKELDSHIFRARTIQQDYRMLGETGAFMFRCIAEDIRQALRAQESGDWVAMSEATEILKATKEAPT